MQQQIKSLGYSSTRRSFLRTGLVAPGAIATWLVSGASASYADDGITHGDIDILRTETQGAARGAVRALTADGLFIGQSDAFFAELRELATRADLAQRRV